MKANTITATELCAIIVSCKANGVSEFIFDKLQIRFGPHTTVLQAPTANQPGETEAQEPTKAQLELIALQERENEEEEKDSLSVLEDPFEMEQRIARGDLSERKA